MSMTMDGTDDEGMALEGVKPLSTFMDVEEEEDEEKEEKDRYEGGSSDEEGEIGGREDEKGEEKDKIDESGYSDDDGGERYCAHML